MATPGSPAADAPVATVRTRSGVVLPLPPQDLRFMSDTDESFVTFGSSLAAFLVEFGLKDTSSLLDVGCAYGRLAIGLLCSTDFRGEYLGFDILRKHVGWCRDSITPAFPKVRFALLDVRNDRYNPRGKIEPEAAVFPARSRAFDMCALFSVFTHMYRSNIERYLGEIRRTLRPGGQAVTTWFSFDEARLPAVLADDCVYPMVHELDATTRYANADDPLFAICHHHSAIREMVAKAGLEIASFERGRWAGGEGRWLQDIAVLRRPVSDTRKDPDPPGFSLASRVRRRARRAVRRVTG